MYRINKYVDLLDRLVWTFLQCFFGYALADALTDSISGGWRDTLMVAGIAALLSAGKTIIAQNVGSSPAGDAIPGLSTAEKV